MGTYMMVIGRMIKNMVKVLTFLQMEIDMREYGKMVIWKVKIYIMIIMVISMLGNGKMGNKMVCALNISKKVSENNCYTKMENL
jgi:hypothetical protein